MDAIDTLRDAIALWNNKFKGSELKAILQEYLNMFFAKWDTVDL
ncbi:hypothetical protein [Scytonema hofmannii]|nr:hypothetical protein [Scytonema hofmannii]